MTTVLLVALRKLLIAAVAVIFLITAAVLAYVNPDPIAVDIGLIRFENVSMSLVLVAAFVAGALFGAVLFGLTSLRHFRERHALRRDLKRAEQELETLRKLLLPDAD